MIGHHLNRLARSVLTVLQVTVQSGALGPLPTHTHRNKTVNIDKIKYIFIVLVLPTKSVLKHTVHDKHRLVWGPYARGVTGQLPNVPMR